jgi:hypothetical protein
MKDSTAAFGFNAKVFFDFTQFTQWVKSIPKGLHPLAMG